MPMIGPSFTDFIANAIQSHDDEPAHVFPMIEAQRERLDALVATTRDHAELTFQCGTHVYYEAGCGPLQSKFRDKLALIFWRYLNPDSVEDGMRIRKAHHAAVQQLPNIDCLIAYFDGRDLQFDLSSTTMLRPGAAP